MDAFLPLNSQTLDPQAETDALMSVAKAQALSSRIAALNEITLKITRSLDVDEILRIIGKQSKWLLDFDHLSVYLSAANSAIDSDRLVNLFGPPLPLSPSQVAVLSPVQRALQSGQPQFLRQSTAGFLPGHSSGLILPLENQHQKFGTINLSSRQPDTYNLDDLRIGYLLALQLSSAIQNAERFAEMQRLQILIENERQCSDQLLLNILPKEIAEELKTTAKVKPVHYPSATVLFTDFHNFTKFSEDLAPETLVEELDTCFSYFDCVADKYGLEKLKTIGDSYMCVGGIPTQNQTHPIDAVLAAIEMQMLMRLRKAQKPYPDWDIRIGIHSGPLMAGVIGRKKFAYDVWGDTVNIASRMETSGIQGEINISGTTYELIKDFFSVEYRGAIEAKNKGKMDMYLVKGIRDILSLDPGRILPNIEFVDRYLAIRSSPAEARLQDWVSLVS